MPKVFISPDLGVEQKWDINTRARGWQHGDDGDVLEHSCLYKAREPNTAHGLDEMSRHKKPKEETALNFITEINGKKIHTLNGSVDPSSNPERTNALWAQASECPRASQWGHPKYQLESQLVLMENYYVGNRVPTPMGSLSLFKWKWLGGNTAFFWLSPNRSPIWSSPHSQDSE